ncbi:thymidylate synthase [Wilcoxina mikolae CBS 423.85]|nr:thymidylate synthase [Wilcoxina mikolae CBS 423.85]
MSTQSEPEFSQPASSTPNDAPEKRHEEYQYLDLIRQILTTGEIRPDRTGTGTISLFAPPSLRFSLTNGTLPLLTTKRVFLRAVVAELLWFISGNTSSLPLSNQGIKIWDGNGSRENLDALGFQDRETGDLGPVYGFQWRHFGAEYKGCNHDYSGEGVDQLAEVIRQITHDPYNRRIILSAWNPKDLKQMVLPPCHMFAQFYVSERKKLSCCLYQRSCDMGLGVPFNIASYALLTHILAHATGLEPGEFVHCMGDAHVYRDHVEALKVQIERTPREWPRVRFVTGGGGGLKEVEEMRVEDVVVEGYRPLGKIEMKMSV